jgi:hypothetical protein
MSLRTAIPRPVLLSLLSLLVIVSSCGGEDPGGEHPLANGLVPLFAFLFILIFAWIAFIGAFIIVGMIVDWALVVRRRRVADLEVNPE